jgi:hypothetical protein
MMVAGDLPSPARLVRGESRELARPAFFGYRAGSAMGAWI